MHVISVSGDDEPPTHFTYPFEMSADYLGMTFGEYMHAFGDDNTIDPIAAGRLREFASKLEK